jgi:predicted outer membrane repeat protein
MSGKRAALAGVLAAGAMMAASPGPAGASSQFERAVAYVPCDPAVLASDVSSAADYETLILAPGCVYRLTEGLRTSAGLFLKIRGNGATLERSYARGTPPFTILQVNTLGLVMNKLGFRHGVNAISVGPGDSIEVDGGTFTANTAVAGGAISGGAGESDITVKGATFIGNKATYGGAIADSNFFGINVTDSKFYRNEAKYGGAIFNGSFTGESLTHVVLHGNAATADGGGIYSAHSPLALANSQVSENQAGRLGGGVYQLSTGPGQDPMGITVTRTQVLGNSARQGGGIYASDTIANFVRSNISHNKAANGGGIFIKGDPRGVFGVARLQSSRLIGNRARGHGGGVYNAGTLTAVSTPFTRNVAARGGGIYDVDLFGPGTAAATLTHSRMRFNVPDNCEPLKSIASCTG